MEPYIVTGQNIPEFVRRNRERGEDITRVPSEEFGNIAEAYRHSVKGQVTGWSLRTTQHMTVFDYCTEETLPRES